MKILITVISLLLIFTSGCKSTAKDKNTNNIKNLQVQQKGMKVEKVSILTPDGMILSADFYKSQAKTNKPIIIMFHMLGSSKEAYLPLINPIVKQNYNVLAIDFRGHGKSSAISDELPKKYPEFTDADWAGLVTDVKSSIEFLKQTKESKNNGVILIGASIGANACIIEASKSKGLEQIKAVILLSPGLNYHNLLIEDSIKESKIKTLVISSEKDDYAFSTFKHIESIDKPNIEFISYSGNSHGTNLFKEHPESISDILNWILKLSN